MEIPETEFKRYIENNISQANYFSCVILYEHSDNLAWYAALRIGEIIKNNFKSRMDYEITIHLTLEITRVIDDLNEMGEHDVILLTTDNENIKPLTSYLTTEVLNKKRNIIFISQVDNPLNRPFKDITRVTLYVNSLSNDKLNCIFEISDKGERELVLTLPDSSLINKYRDIRSTLLQETIKRQVPELEDQD